MGDVRDLLTEESLWAAVAVAAIGIVVAGFVATQAPDISTFVERGIALGTQVVGFIVEVAGLLKGGQVLARTDARAGQIGAVGLVALAGAALVFVGTLVAA